MNSTMQLAVISVSFLCVIFEYNYPCAMQRRKKILTTHFTKSSFIDGIEVTGMIDLTKSPLFLMFQPIASCQYQLMNVKVGEYVLSIMN